MSFLAGISTVIGALVIFFDKRKNNKIVEVSLSFASGVMMCVSLTDLLPNSFKMILDNNNLFPKIILSLIFMTFGIIISMLIDKYLPDNNLNTDNKSLYKIGIISMVAIVLHNIPEGISIAVPIYYSTKNRKKAFLYTLVSGMSEFLGAIFASIFLTSFSNDFFMGCLYAIIAGIMIHISVYELLPSSLKYHKYSTTFLFFFLGIIVMFISCLLLH